MERPRRARLNAVLLYASITALAVVGDAALAADPPWGACCLGAECSLQNQDVCESWGGTFLGPGTSCDGNPCHPNSGDDCGDARPAVPGDNPFSTVNGSDSGFGSPDDSMCEGTYLDWLGSSDFWFRWTAPGSGTISLDTCDPSSYDTSLVVYAGTDCGSLTQVACNGDALASEDCQSFYSAILDLPVSSGETYWLRLGGWEGATGVGTLHLSYSGPSDPIGACCLGGSCESLTEAECIAVGGLYAGDDADCATISCDGELAACCIGGDCQLLPVDDCGAIGGISLPPGSSCADAPCGAAGEAVSVRWHVIGTDLVAGEASYTVDVYADLPEGWRLDAVAGNSLNQKTIASSSSFYQDALGGPTSLEVNPAMYPLAPDLEFDSRVTIGAIDVTGDPFPENALNSIGIDWTDFESGGVLSVSDGTWFVLPIDEQGEARSFVDQQCDAREGVLMARLTSLGHASEMLVAGLFQGRDKFDVLWQDTASAMIAYGGEQDCNGNRVADACDIAGGASEDNDGNGIPDECESGCGWDLDGDGVVGVDDLLMLINEFGAAYGVDDLLALIAEYGCGGP